MAMKETREQRFETALRRIAAYDSPARLRRDSERSYGLDYAEALEMAYENIQGEAKAVLRGLRKRKPDVPKDTEKPRQMEPAHGTETPS